MTLKVSSATGAIATAGLSCKNKQCSILLALGLCETNITVSRSALFTESVNMVAVPRLNEMKYAETRLSAESIELTKHSKTDSDVNSLFIIDK